jgi:DNA-binding MarR family transcriptional regulator
MTPAIDTAGAAGERSGAPPDAVNPQRALDDLLATLERGELSPTEVRVLLSLAEREATVAELTDALQQRPGALTSVVYRLAMRGLIRRRFESGQWSGFVFAITSAGMLALRPLLQRVSEPAPQAGTNSPRDEGSGMRPARRFTLQPAPHRAAGGAER